MQIKNMILSVVSGIIANAIWSAVLAVLDQG